MTRYIAQRLLVGLLTAFIVSLLIFVITYIHFKPESFIMPLGGEELTEKDLRMNQRGVRTAWVLAHAVLQMDGWLDHGRMGRVRILE